MASMVRAARGVGGVINMHDLPNGCAVFNGHPDFSS